MSACVVVYVSITSFIVMSIKHLYKGERGGFGGIWWSAYLLLTMLPLRLTGARLRAHTLFQPQQRRAAWLRVTLKSSLPLQLDGQVDGWVLH